MRTYVEHIAYQVAKAVQDLSAEYQLQGPSKMLITGGGAKNTFLIRRISEMLKATNVSAQIASADLIDFKEAIIMALIAVLRWREEFNTISTVTGASRNSIGGAVWIGQEA